MSDNNNVTRNIWQSYCIPLLSQGRPNTKYVSNYKRYIDWLEKQFHSEEDNGITVRVEYTRPERAGDPIRPLYITQNNVEMYFRYEVAVNHDGIKSTIKQTFDSLRTIGMKWEHPFHPEIVLSPFIRSAMEEQQRNNNNRKRFVDSCPHNCLKDVMSPEDVEKIINYIYTSRPDSLDLAFVFLWGINAGLRSSTSRSLVLSDLFSSNGYGPEDKSPRNFTLMAVLRKGSANKDKHLTDRQVGVQRHVDYRLCTVFATGMLVIDTLRTSPNISFKKQARERAPWWDVSLNRYSTYEQVANAINKVYEGTGVEFAKTTHFRTQAVQYAGSHGLSMELIQTMTKHNPSKLHTSYAPEAVRECMKVMSGFSLVSFKIYYYKLCTNYSNLGVNVLIERKQICERGTYRH